MNIVYVVHTLSFVKVQGVITEYETVSFDNRFGYYVTVEYESSGSKYMAVKRTGYIDEYAVGGEMTVKINPKNPSETEDLSMLGRYAAMDTLLVILLAGVTYAAVNQGKSTERFKKRSESKSYLVSNYELEKEENKGSYNNNQ